MAEFFDQLSEDHTSFISEQPLFFVATAASEGRINLSPKGMDCFRVLSPTKCGYLDMTGSGNETAAHIKADGRLTFMFNSFGQKPLILRLYGHGSVARVGTDGFKAYADQFPDLPGARQLIFMDIESVQTSCGFAVPQMTLVEERQVLAQWAKAKGPEEIAAYQREKNAKSIDGLDTGL